MIMIETQTAISTITMLMVAMVHNNRNSHRNSLLCRVAKESRCFTLRGAEIRSTVYSQMVNRKTVRDLLVLISMMPFTPTISETSIMQDLKVNLSEVDCRVTTQ